ncbi:nuclease [Kineococcus terrestris]|uniref:nuclease n=1 Tax=Kineococcus terrestris TaxID=2044856 RepID=UPI0034DB4DBF
MASAASTAYGDPGSGGQGTTYVLIDGENIDATLGASILDGRPAPEQRPRWERLLDFARTTFQQPAKGLFFLNATSGHLPMSFVQALLAIGYQPIPLAGTGGEKVVDIGIQRTLEAIVPRDGDVLLATHDADFVPQVDALLTGDRLVGLFAFREFVSSHYTPLVERGLKVFDLEDDVRAFNVVLPRVRIIPLGDFDPVRYL